MKKVNNKKGFTLAELLVVLAILAVLVAVAIPLFTGAIGNAQKTTRDANVRALRAAAVVEILSDDGSSGYGTTGPWTAEATIGDTGDMTGLTVAPGSVATETIPTSGVTGTYKINITSLN